MMLRALLTCSPFLSKMPPPRATVCPIHSLKYITVLYLVLSVCKIYNILVQLELDLSTFTVSQLRTTDVVGGAGLTSCSVRLSRNSRVLTAVQSCCISRRGMASSPGGKGSSSLPGLSPKLQSAGSRLVGRLGSLEEKEE